MPSSGSTATSTAGPLPSPTSSPLKSIGASSFSPSPITTLPRIRTVSRIEPHRVDGGRVGALLLPAPDPARCGERGGLGDAHEVEGEVAVGDGGAHARRILCRCPRARRRVRFRQRREGTCPGTVPGHVPRETVAFVTKAQRCVHSGCLEGRRSVRNRHGRRARGTCAPHSAAYDRALPSRCVARTRGRRP